MSEFLAEHVGEQAGATDNSSIEVDTDRLPETTDLEDVALRAPGEAVQDQVTNVISTEADEETGEPTHTTTPATREAHTPVDEQKNTFERGEAEDDGAISYHTTTRASREPDPSDDTCDEVAAKEATTNQTNSDEEKTPEAGGDDGKDGGNNDTNAGSDAREDGDGEDDSNEESGEDIPRLSRSTFEKLAFLEDKTPITDNDEDGNLARVSYPAMPPEGYLSLGFVEVEVMNVDGHSTARIGNLQVDPDIRGFGTGTSILQALADTCRARGIECIDGYCISPEAIGARVNAFGEDDQFYHESVKGMFEPLPMTPSQAMESLTSERLEELAREKGGVDHVTDMMIYARVNL